MFSHVLNESLRIRVGCLGVFVTLRTCRFAESTLLELVAVTRFCVTLVTLTRLQFSLRDPCMCIGHAFTYRVFTHPLSYQRGHSSIHLSKHSFICSCVHSFTVPHVREFDHLIHVVIQAFTYPCFRLYVQCSCIHAFTDPRVHDFAHLIQMFIQSFTHPCIR